LTATHNDEIQHVYTIKVQAPRDELSKLDPKRLIQLAHPSLGLVVPTHAVFHHCESPSRVLSALADFMQTPLIISGIFYGANTEYQIDYVDCLFLCVSAMTVTGLATNNLSQLNGYQQSLLFVQMFEFCLPACFDDMPEFLLEKILANHDHDETDCDDIAHDHLHEQEPNIFSNKNSGISSKHAGRQNSKQRKEKRLGAVSSRP
jgi:hypothetical protein